MAVWKLIPEQIKHLCLRDCSLHEEWSRHLGMDGNYLSCPIWVQNARQSLMVCPKLLTFWLNCNSVAARCAGECPFAVICVIFDLLISTFELFIGDTSGNKRCFLGKENLASFTGCCKLAFIQVELTATGGLSVRLGHGFAAGCDVCLPCQHHVRLGFT